MQLGSRLTELRKKNNYTQKQLADALNLSQQVISNIERSATSPDIEFLKGLADLYHISLDELVGRKFNFPEAKSFEQQMFEMLETMNDKEKELSLRLVNEVAQHRSSTEDK